MEISPFLVMAIAVSAFGVTAYYLLTNKPKRKTANAESKLSPKVEAEINELFNKPRLNTELKDGMFCRIYDNLTLPARVYNGFITKQQAKEIFDIYGTIGVQKTMGNDKVYPINRFKDDKGNESLRPVIVKKDISNAPMSLYYDNKHTDAEIICQEFMKEENQSFTEKYGQVLWWIAVMGFIAFMWASSPK